MKSKWNRLVIWTVLFWCVLFSFVAGAEEWVCDGYDHPLPLNNRQVIHWKKTTKNQYRDRAHIEGPVLQVFRSKGDHVHLEVQLGKRPHETIELIYNQLFGRLDDPETGAFVQACGDYITATERSGNYPPSPVGAILHWVHARPRGSHHQNGFLILNGKVFGQDIENVKPRPRRPRPRPQAWPQPDMGPQDFPLEFFPLVLEEWEHEESQAE